MTRVLPTSRVFRWGYITRKRVIYFLCAIPFPVEDENECDRQVCTFPSLCRNTVGSYACDCPEGFENRGNKDTARCVGKCIRWWAAGLSSSKSMELWHVMLYQAIRSRSCMLRRTICYGNMLCYAMLCYAMLCYAMLCYAMLCYAMLCCAVLCYAALCYMPFHTLAVLCCAVRCGAVLCGAMLYWVLQPSYQYRTLQTSKI